MPEPTLPVRSQARRRLERDARRQRQARPEYDLMQGLVPPLPFDYTIPPEITRQPTPEEQPTIGTALEVVSRPFDIASEYQLRAFGQGAVTSPEFQPPFNYKGPRLRLQDMPSPIVPPREALSAFRSRPTEQQIVGGLVDVTLPIPPVGAAQLGMKAVSGATRAAAIAAKGAKRSELLRELIKSQRGGLAETEGLSLNAMPLSSMSQRIAEGNPLLAERLNGIEWSLGTGQLPTDIERVVRSKTNQELIALAEAMPDIARNEVPRWLTGRFGNEQSGVPGQVGALQSSMGIGEQAPQGTLNLGGRIAANEPVPLINEAAIVARQGRRAEEAAGQGSLPSVLDEPVTSLGAIPALEQARIRLDEARAMLEAEQARGLPAPKFGTRERAEFDAVRRAASSEGRPIISKKVRVQQAREKVREARLGVEWAERDAQDAGNLGDLGDLGDVAQLAGSQGVPPTPPLRPPVVSGASEVPDEYRAHLATFTAFLNDPNLFAQELTQAALWREERGRRIINYDDAVNWYMDHGYASEEAMRLATKELSGHLPIILTGIERQITEDFRNTLFDEVRLFGFDKPYERPATVRALSRALEGKIPPRTPGTKGGSAYRRLLRVFGEDITEAITQGDTYQEVIHKRLNRVRALARQRGGAIEVYTRTSALEPHIDYPSTAGATQQRLLREPSPLATPGNPRIPEKPPYSFPANPQNEQEQELYKYAVGYFLKEGAWPSKSLWVHELQRRGYPPTQTFGGVERPPLIPEPGTLTLSSPQGRLIAEKPVRAFPAMPVDLRPQIEKELDAMAFRRSLGEQAKLPTGTMLGSIGPLPKLSQAVIDRFGLFSRARRADMLQWLREGEVSQEAIAEFARLPQTDRANIGRWAKTVGLTAIDFGNLLRANIASVDISYLRQQAFLIPGNAAAFAKSFPDALRAIWSEIHAKRLDRQIDSDLAAMNITERPTFLRALDSKIAQAWEREESFMVLGGDRPLQRLAHKMMWVGISNRAFVTGINSMNMHILKGHARMLERIGDQIATGQIKLKPGEMLDPQKSMKQFSAMLADMSGRGPLGPLKELSPALNAGLFSVRLQIGRLISPRHLFASDPYTRRAAMKNFLTAIGGYSSILFGGQQMGLWDLETDPRSSDFMKLRIGNLRLDLWGGYQQYAVLYARLLAGVGGIKSMETSKISEFDPVMGIPRFVRTKAAPGISQILTAWTGRDFKGSLVDRRDWQYWLKENMPLAIQDVFEGYEAEGLLGLFAAAPSVLGMGVAAHAPTLTDVAQQLYGASYDTLPATGQGQVAREIVRMELEKQLSEKERSLVEQRARDVQARTETREEERRAQFYKERNVPGYRDANEVVKNSLAATNAAIWEQYLQAGPGERKALIKANRFLLGVIERRNAIRATFEQQHQNIVRPSRELEASRP